MSTESRECVSVDRGVVKLAGIGFGLWSVLLPLTAWWVMEQINSMQAKIAPGILPITSERLRSIERDVNRIESEWRNHDKWAESQHAALEAELAALKLEIARHKK